ncbi:MAG: GAF domain-containing protein [Candidatus Cloacimonetes bacterium]|nr:GAF domain-containing protein [Candidatus Cloacimonadota bacterium]
MESRKKKERYQRITEQLHRLFLKTDNRLARMSTAVALLHHKFEYFFWTGVYLLEKGELTIGPYQGSLACLVLPPKTGVCWTAIEKNETIIVSNVEKFPGHIACDSRSRSEIAIPIRDKNGMVIGVLDVDSREMASFDATDAAELEKIVRLF